MSRTLNTLAAGCIVALAAAVWAVPALWAAESLDAGPEGGIDSAVSLNEDVVDMPKRKRVVITAIPMELPNPDDDVPRAPRADNIARARGLLDQAGKRGSDVALLPEIFATKRTTVQGQAEAVPVGPASTMMAEAARKYRMYVIGSIYEQDGDKVYNTAAIFDRDGKLVGKYRKTHLPDEELQAASAGDSYPTFKTDFGTIGVMICWDMHFPEAARCLALGGAEIIFWPTMYGNKETASTFMKARAMEDKVYMVSADYVQSRGNHVGFTGVINPKGGIVAENDRTETPVTAIVNLDDRPASPVLSRERRTETYGRIVE